MTAVLRTLLEITIYAAVLYGAISLFRRLLGAKTSPRLRLALWALLVVRLLLPVTWESPVHPFALSAQPAVQTARPSVAPTAAPIQLVLPAGLPAQAVASITRPTAQPSGWLPDENVLSLSTPATPNPTPWRLDWWQAVLTLWLAGAAATAGVFTAQSLGLRRRLRLASIPDARLCALLADAQNALGLRRAPRLLVAGEGSPALTVSPRPALLLPRWMAAQLGDPELSAALRHELTHYRHGHHLMALALIVLRCAYWFHPCVWLMARDMREDMELACDAAVVAIMGAEERRAYAQTLLTLYGRGTQPRLAVAMAGSTRHTAERRLRSVFDPARTVPAARFVALTLAALLGFGCFTTACQPTPTKPAVIQKSGAALMEAIDKGNRDVQDASTATPGASGIPARYADIPATWQDTATAKPFPIQVDINAKVTVPTADKLPVTVVRPVKYTQEQIDGLLALVGQAPYHLDKDQIKTRSYYIDAIVELQEGLSKVDDNEEYTQEQKEQYKKDYKATIQRLQKDMLTAPETVDDIVDPVFTNQYMIQSAGTPDYYGDDTPEIINKTSEQRMAEAKANLEKMGMEEITIQWEKDHEKFGLGARRSDVWQNNFISYYAKRGEYSGWNTVDAVGNIKNMKTTWDQAKTLAEQAAASLGMDYLSLARSAKIIEYTSKTDLYLDKSETFTDFGKASYREEQAYEFAFTRGLNGVNETYATNIIDTNQYAEGVPYERLTVVVDDKGVRSLGHTGPCTTLGEQLSADVKLLDFEQIRSIALDQFTRGNLRLGGDYPPQSEKEAQWFVRGQVWIDNVTLGYARVKLGDGSGRYALVPAWDFFGYWAIRQDSDDPNDPSNNYSAGRDMRRWSILTINAVDGSIIDRSKGY